MTQVPAISVLMSVYNGESHIYASVRSILAQTWDNFELLIVNDGSTDRSGAIVRDLAAEDGRIRLVDRENRGLIASLNEALALARAPLLARMDADDIAMPDRFRRQVEYLAAHPDVGVLGTNAHDLDERGQIIAGTTFFPETDQEVRETLKHDPPLSHPTVMMRTALIRELGGYRAAFAHAEDYDLWLRCSRHTRITSLRERLLLYRRSHGQISQRYHSEQTYAAAVAWLAHRRVLDGKGDPFDHLTSIPNENELDEAFGERGAREAVMKLFVERMRYSHELLAGKKFDLMLAQARRCERFDGAARTILRLARMGHFGRAAELGMALATPR